MVLTPRHIGGVATEASAQVQSAQAQYTAKKVKTANEIDFTGNTKYAIKAVRAVGTSDLSTVLKGRFLRYGYVSQYDNPKVTYVMIGYPPTTTTNTGYTSEKDICDHMGDKGDGDNYTFTFDGNANEFTVKNCADGTLWGNYGTKHRPIGQGHTSIIKVKLYEKENEEFTLETNGNPYRHTNADTKSHSAYINYNATKNLSVLYFEIYEIAETKTQATFNYYQGTSKVPYASVTKEVKSGNTIKGLAEVPTYLTATYYKIIQVSQVP